MEQLDQVVARRGIRLWPGVAAAVLLVLARFVVPMVAPGTLGFGVIAGLLGALAIFGWWIFFSRAPWLERVGAIVLMIVALVGTSRLVHVSIRTGMMGMMLPFSALPILSLALVAWAAVSLRFSVGLRRASLLLTILLVCAAFTLLRTGGIAGDGSSDWKWRWSQSPEERLLLQANHEPMALGSKQRGGAGANDQPAILQSNSVASNSPADWPGFRGPARDGIVRGARIETDWSRSPPVQLWRRPIGPGWSSFAVHNDLLYTQEQRGEDEMVACYKVPTGEPVWAHRDAVRFWESNGGAGPRATPTLSKGRVYAFGATGILNALEATNGAVVWSRNVGADADQKVPMWGFASSPLVLDDLIIVAAAGKLAAYDLANGAPRWFGPARGGGYSSPQRWMIDGVGQILLLSTSGITSVAPSDGVALWEQTWPGMPIVQPALAGDGNVLISACGAAGGIGTRRLQIAHGLGGWAVSERWMSTGLKPYFNDLVVHRGYAFGFDGGILACIDLENGKRKWKGGRYGNGQLVLLADQDVLLVLSEAGELALVGATPDQFRELARFAAIKGKTWNHPVLVGHVLLVRNGEEMAAFRLPLSGY